MNIFFLSISPEEAARMMCDKHVIKMFLECVQIMCTVYRLLTGNEEYANFIGLYKKTHSGHPPVKWAMASTSNFMWLYSHAMALCEEHKYRYEREEYHKSRAIALKVGDEFFVHGFDTYFKSTKFTRPPLVMPKRYQRIGSVIECYRRFYIEEKRDFAQWTMRPPPEWWPFEGHYRASRTLKRARN